MIRIEAWRITDESSTIAFSDNGQLETVGDGFQGLHDKLLERALLDYLENIPEQVSSSKEIYITWLFWLLNSVIGFPILRMTLQLESWKIQVLTEPHGVWCCLQEEPVASIFRERERSTSRKRGGTGDRMNIDLAQLIMSETLDGSPYDPNEMEDGDNYLTALQTLYDRYRAGRGNKVYE